MAMRYGYFDSEITGVDENGMPIFDRAETSDLFRMLFANLVSNGVLATPGDCFQVVAGAGMTVRIRPGFAMIKGAFAYDADEATVTLAAANANLPRVDRVVLRCNYYDRCCEIIVKTGTPATIPVAPELLQPVNGDYYELGLALITVAANQAAITQSSITDTRADSSVCGLITQLIDHIDTSEFMQQLTTWQEEYAAEQQAAFSTWFEAMKDQLSEDAAGNLQLEIDNLSQSAEAHEESIGQINEIIGDADMGTTATTVTGAINELHDKVDADIPDLISDSISNALNSALKWKILVGHPTTTTSKDRHLSLFPLRQRKSMSLSTLNGQLTIRSWLTSTSPSNRMHLVHRKTSLSTSNSTERTTMAMFALRRVLPTALISCDFTRHVTAVQT